MRILALDGGGYRGLVTSTFLERVWPLGPAPDLYAGTSTGGIIALCLAFGMSPSEITAMYRDRGPEIFARSSLGAIFAKYSAAGLRAVLESVFGSTTLGQLNAKVVVPTFALSQASPRLPDAWGPRFMTNLDLPGNDRELRCVDAALRTSAAPTYFPSADRYVDGGLVANDPALVALSIALRAGAYLPDCRVLSVGTGASYQRLAGSDLNWGVAEWAPRLIPLLLDANVSNAELCLPGILGDDYFRVNPTLPRPIELDDVGAAEELMQIGYGAVNERIACQEWVAGRWNA